MEVRLSELEAETAKATEVLRILEDKLMMTLSNKGQKNALKETRSSPIQVLSELDQKVHNASQDIAEMQQKIAGMEENLHRTIFEVKENFASLEQRLESKMKQQLNLLTQMFGEIKGMVVNLVTSSKKTVPTDCLASKDQISANLETEVCDSVDSSENENQLTENVQSTKTRPALFESVHAQVPGWDSFYPQNKNILAPDTQTDPKQISTPFVNRMAQPSFNLSNNGVFVSPKRYSALEKITAQTNPKNSYMAHIWPIFTNLA